MNFEQINPVMVAFPLALLVVALVLTVVFIRSRKSDPVDPVRVAFPVGLVLMALIFMPSLVTPKKSDGGSANAITVTCGEGHTNVITSSENSVTVRSWNGCPRSLEYAVRGVDGHDT